MIATSIAASDYRSLGALLVGTAAVIVLLLAFYGRTRLPASLLIGGLAIAGGVLGLGAALLEAGVYAGGLGGQRIAAIATLALLTPLHVRVLLGRLGKQA